MLSQLFCYLPSKEDWEGCLEPTAMNEFRARYVNSNGEIVSGTFNSASEADLRHRLSEQGCYVYSVDEKGKGLSGWGGGRAGKKSNLPNSSFSTSSFWP